MKSVDQIAAELKANFVDELKKEGNFWKIFRTITFIDLLISESVKYGRFRGRLELYMIANLALKLKTLSHIKEVEVADILDEELEQFNKDNDIIVETYEDVLNSCVAKVNLFTDLKIDSIFHQIETLRQMKENPYDSVMDQTLDNIVCIIINALRK